MSTKKPTKAATKAVIKPVRPSPAEDPEKLYHYFKKIDDFLTWFEYLYGETDFTHALFNATIADCARFVLTLDDISYNIKILRNWIIERSMHDAHELMSIDEASEADNE